ncbi:Uncharacterised protein [Shigella dysenteriae]|nr:Uncharacterised protein [Shigella dysenteriae]
MFRPFLDSLMLGSLFFPFIAIAGSTAQGGVIHFYGQIVEPACDVSTQSSPVEMNCPQNGSMSGQNLLQQSVNERQCQKRANSLSKSAVS